MVPRMFRSPARIFLVCSALALYVACSSDTPDDAPSSAPPPAMSGNVTATAGSGSPAAAGSSAAAGSGSGVSTGAAGAPAAGSGAAGGFSAGAGSGGGLGGSGAAGAAGIPAAGSGGVGAGSGGEGGAGGAAAGGAEGQAGAAADGGSERPPFVADGQPITAGGDGWTWVQFPDTQCRDGSPAGISVSLRSASAKVMIFLQGGGACFDSGTCGVNPANVPLNSQKPTDVGILDRSQAANPVKDWNFVYVPYCSGDVHIGDKQDVSVTGVAGMQQFRGRANLAAFLKRLIPTFPNADQVLLTGVSAGGFGAQSNWEFVSWAWASVPITMLDDSGPTMSSQFVPQCLNDLYVKYWGLDQTLYSFCGSDCDGSAPIAEQYADHVVKLTRDLHGGLIESNADSTIRAFNGIGTDNGKNDCMGSLFLTTMDASTFENGLSDIRMRAMASQPNFGTYYPNSMQHTWLLGATFYTATAGMNVKMVDWVSDIIAGKPATHVGP